MEATPEGETFEGRRRVRWIVSGVAGLAILVSLITVWRSLRSNEVEMDSVPATNQNAEMAHSTLPPKLSPIERENEAKELLADARVLEKGNKVSAALAKVERVISEFGESSSAPIALAARERNRQGLPLFVAGAAIVATKSEGSEPADPTVEVDPVRVAPVEVVAAPIRTPILRPIPSTGGALPIEARRPIEVGLPRAKIAARLLPQGFHSRPEAGVHTSGWPLEIVCEKDGGTLVLVPGDQFIQGRDDGKSEERPAHRVQLATYYIDQHELTARQFGAFKPGANPPNDRPVGSVSLPEARAYAQWAGKSIPSEAQWEMAARTTDGRLHPWGNAAASWERGRQPKQIDPVMSFPSDMSPYGVFDLAGNAWEWTNDWFDTKYYAHLKGQTTHNPTGPSKGTGRLSPVVIKGGSPTWDGSWRSEMRPDAKLPYLGFRCVLNLDSQSTPGSAAPLPANAPTAAPGGVVPF